MHAHDAPALSELIHGLSHQDRRWRFHGAANGVTPDRLRGMTCVEPKRHLALVVIAHLPGHDELVADARFAVDDTGQGAEFAVMVATAWRRLYVGESAMLALQRAAAESGLRWLHGSVLVDNTPMLALMRRCGFLITPNRGDDAMVAVEARVDRAWRVGTAKPSSTASRGSSGSMPRWLLSSMSQAIPR